MLTKESLKVGWLIVMGKKKFDRCVPIAFVVMMGWVSLRVDGKMVMWGGLPQLRRLTRTTTTCWFDVTCLGYLACRDWFIRRTGVCGKMVM